MLTQALRRITAAILQALEGNPASIYLYGSAAMQDHRPGWSDIDLLVLTEQPLSPSQAQTLLHLRQRLAEKEDDGIYRTFEGGMLPLEAFLRAAPCCAVYWGTSGQRIADGYTLDSFSALSLLDRGVLLHGQDVRSRLPRPSRQELHGAVLRHYNTIRQYARETGRSLYSFGWLLDIARGLYTLRTGDIIAKTAAGEWALGQGLCPDPAAMETAIFARRDPLAALADPAVMSCAQTLGPAIQRFADVLEAQLFPNK